MPYILKYPGGEKQEPDAYRAEMQVKYLTRDGYVPIQIIGPEGSEISLAELGERALGQFRAR